MCQHLLSSFITWYFRELLVFTHTHTHHTHTHTHTHMHSSGWDKLDVNVKFPMSGLDLTGYVKNPDDPEPVYDLFAVLHHSGDMGGSHCE